MLGKPQKGLSLVEMLVVIVVVSLVSALLIQGLGTALSLYNKVQYRQNQLNMHAMAQEWLRKSISAALSNRYGKQELQGNTDKLALVTLRPVLSEEGVLTRIEWEIDENGLIYREGDKELELKLMDARPVAIEYMDSNLSWHDRWPLRRTNMELPEAIRVNYEDGEITSVLRSHKPAVFYVDEINFGRE